MEEANKKSVVSNHFHFEVVKKLKVKEWNVKVSPYYADNFSEQAREIDILASKIFPIVSDKGGNYGNIEVFLYIECKYLNQELVFWFDKIDESEVGQFVNGLVGIKSRDYNRQAALTKNHYLEISEVAKLWSTKKEDDNYDPTFRALNQTLNSLIYFRKQNPDTHQKTRWHLPVVVVQNYSNIKKFMVQQGEKTPAEITEDFFTIEVNYAYKSTSGDYKSEYFLIDVVSIDNLDKYMVTLADDLSAEKFQIIQSCPALSWGA